MRTDSPFPISAFFLDIGKKWKLSIDYELFGWRASLILRSWLFVEGDANFDPIG